MVQFLDFRKTQELDKGINLAGIINSEVLVKKCKKEKRMFRIGLILPCRTQVLIDLWSETEENRPTFHKNWEALQLIIIFDLVYAGEIFEGGKVIKIFRAGKKEYNLRRRFILLSDEISNFWDDPIHEFKGNFDIVQESYEIWPGPIPTGRGKLKRSKGSVFGPSMKYWADNFDTESIEPFEFCELQKLHLAVRKSLRGYVNLLTGKETKNDLIFQR